MSYESRHPITQIFCASLDTCVQRKMVKMDLIVSTANAHKFKTLFSNSISNFIAIPHVTLKHAF